MYLFVLGRQTELCLAELKSVFGDKNIEKIPRTNLALYKAKRIFENLNFLGGTVKVVEVIGTYNQNDISLEKIKPLFPNKGKITIGLSGVNYNLKKIINQLSELKENRSIRIIPTNKSGELTSATVFNNKLYKGGNKFEIYFAKLKSGNILIGKTIFVQNINQYNYRDSKKPNRDAKNGMLPPKLAQIMLNLVLEKSENIKNKVVLDAFCGTGTVLIEAGFMGAKKVIGTDVNPKMVKFTGENLEFFNIKNYEVKSADAKIYHWKSQVDYIISECYLGKPYKTIPSEKELAKNMSYCNDLISKFIKNAKSQFPNVKICIAVPVWFVKNDVKHLPLVSGLKLKKGPFVYRREGQIVGREIIVF